MVRRKTFDFYYDEEDFELLKKDILFISQFPTIDNIVIKFINKDNTLDIAHLKQILKIQKHLNITFHKAFDLIEDQKLAFLKLQ